MECKRNTDGRKIDRKSKEVLRIRVVQQVLKGISPEKLAKTLDINARTIYRWLERYNKGGESSLKNRDIPGRPKKLNQVQVKWITHAISESPSEYGFEPSLWTCEMVRSLIRQQFEIQIGKVTTSKLLQGMGINTQSPIEALLEKAPKLMKQWQVFEYPRILKTAKQQNARVFFARNSLSKQMESNGGGLLFSDSANESNHADSTLRTAVTVINQRRQHRFLLYPKTLTPDLYCRFLRQLIKGESKKLVLILGDNDVQRSAAVRELAKTVPEQLELIYLPLTSFERPEMEFVVEPNLSQTIPATNEVADLDIREVRSAHVSE